MAGLETTFWQPGLVFQFRLFSSIIFSKSLLHAHTWGAKGSQRGVGVPWRKQTPEQMKTGPGRYDRDAELVDQVGSLEEGSES